MSRTLAIGVNQEKEIMVNVLADDSSKEINCADSEAVKPELDKCKSKLQSGAKRNEVSTVKELESQSWVAEQMALEDNLKLNPMNPHEPTIPHEFLPDAKVVPPKLIHYAYLKRKRRRKAEHRRFTRKKKRLEKKGEPGEEGYMCETCGKQYKIKIWLLNHQKKHLKNPQTIHLEESATPPKELAIHPKELVIHPKEPAMHPKIHQTLHPEKPKKHHKKPRKEAMPRARPPSKYHEFMVKQREKKSYVDISPPPLDDSELPYQCKCLRRFPDIPSLVLHAANAHPELNCGAICGKPNVIKKVPIPEPYNRVGPGYGCKQCNFVCFYKERFMQHMRTHKKGENTGGTQAVFRCKECDYPFENVDDIKRHLTTKHNVPLKNLTLAEMKELPAEPNACLVIHTNDKKGDVGEVVEHVLDSEQNADCYSKEELMTKNAKSTTSLNEIIVQNQEECISYKNIFEDDLFEATPYFMYDTHTEEQSDSSSDEVT